MSKLSFRARALDASKPMPIYLAEELPDLPDYSAINRAVPQMPSGMEKEEESEHHLQRAISGTGLIIPTPEVYEVQDIEFYERCYPADYKMPKQHIHMQPLWEEQEAPEYDIDSEDEKWLKQRRHPELTDLKFEQMMDKLEKSSGQTVVTLNEAQLLLERSDELVTAVYDYWLNKRLSTQHPLILSVKTEARGGVSTNNPYLAFRRRTEKMQTRKNRKNDESSYEKMLKLRRDLVRALTLLEFVARREKAKRDLVRLTAALAERRYQAGDFASQLLPDPPPRPQYQVPITASFRREPYTVQHFPARAPPTPIDQPRQREKRPYKRRKHRHHAPGVPPAPRDSGVYTSSEEEQTPRAEEEGPFAFHRKPGCYYEMPTSTLWGDPVDPKDPKPDLFEHEIDERYRYTLTSLRGSDGSGECIGFARRRLGRGGRVLLDRIRTPLDKLWPRLPPSTLVDDRQLIQEEIETKSFRTPKEFTTDYHTSGRHPWRHAFRKHLSEEPHLWIDDIKPDTKQEDVKYEDNSDKTISERTVISDSEIRKRVLSDCSDSSYDSDESLAPVEREFEKFINEVNTEWLHFRPKTPPPSPPNTKMDEDFLPLSQDTPLTVEVHAAESPPSGILAEPFTTSEFTLRDLYPDIPNDIDNSGNSLDISNDDLLNENLGLTEAQVETILSETDLKVLEDVDDKKIAEEFLDELGRGFLYRAGGGGRGCSTVRLSHVDNDVIYIEKPEEEKCKITDPSPAPRTAPRTCSPSPRHTAAAATAITTTTSAATTATSTLTATVTSSSTSSTAPAAASAAASTAASPAAASPRPTTQTTQPEAINDLPPVKLEPQKKRKEDTIEEVQLPHGVQLKTVQTKHSPLKKHIITSMGHRKMAEVSVVTTSKEAQQGQQPQIVTVAVSDSLKVRLQNHLMASQGGNVVGLVQNGPFTAVALPVHSHSEHGIAVSAGTSSSPGSTPGRRTTPLLQLATGTIHKPLHHVPANRLKLLHNRSVGSVVSLGAIQPPALIKPAHPHLATLFDIKGGQLGKGPHLVNVVRGGNKPAVARLDLNDASKRHYVATFDTAHLKTNITGGGSTGSGRGRVSVSVESRGGSRAGTTSAGGPTIPTLTPHLRQHIHLHSTPRPPNQVVGNLVQKTVQVGVGGRGVQAVALSAAQLKRLAPHHHTAEIVEASTASVAASSSATESTLEPRDSEEQSNGVRRRATDNLPMEVT